MAERFELSFKNKEVKMWFITVGPAFIIGAIALYNSTPSTRWLPFLILMIGYAIYYPWRYRYRKEQKAAGRRQ